MLTAACHIHSDWSYDGKWSVQALSGIFGRRGYRILLMTEHDRGFSPERLDRYRECCAQANSEKILVIPGIEYSDASNTVHVLVWGPVPFLGEALPTASLLQQVRRSNGVAVLAHPARRNAWKVFDPAWCELLLGIEIWNRKTDGWAPNWNTPSSMHTSQLVPFVGMDFHDWNQIFPLAMALKLPDNPTEEQVINCLRSRECHALAFGRPAQDAQSPWLRPVLHSAETCRRRAAAIYRSAKKYAHGMRDRGRSSGVGHLL
jgi:hypothetical protein